MGVFVLVNIAKIKEIARSKGITLNHMTRILNEEPGYFNKVNKGLRKISDPRIREVARMLNTTYAYLTDETNDPSPASEIVQSVKIKVFGDVAAGKPIEQIDNFDPDDASSFEEINERTARKGEYFALRIKGDSMLPDMRTGDVVICKVQDCADDGDIAIVGVADEATCKKIKKTPEGIMLMPLNSAYMPMFYSNEQIDQFNVRILGKVVEVRRKM